jgi:hypothetical protein
VLRAKTSKCAADPGSTPGTRSATL